MTDEQLTTTAEPTGAELDAAIAEALGWTLHAELGGWMENGVWVGYAVDQRHAADRLGCELCGHERSFLEECIGPPWEPSTNITQAVALLSRMEQRGWAWGMCTVPSGCGGYMVSFGRLDESLIYARTADTLPLAIARAALAALRAEKETNAR